MKMKGYAMLGIGKTGWIEKEMPACGPLDAIVRPLAVSPCTSDIHTVWEGAIGERHDMILGHEAVGEVVETGSLVRDFRPGDRVIVPAITPDWGSVEAQAGYAMHSGGMLAGWKFSNFKDGVFAERFHVNEADANLAHLPRGVKIEDAVMLSDMVPTGFHGAELADVQYGESVCVIGIGPVGLMAVAAARLRGASRLFAVGSRPRCAEAARFTVRPTSSTTARATLWRRSWMQRAHAAWIRSSSPAAAARPLRRRSKCSAPAERSATSTISEAVMRFAFRAPRGAAAWDTSSSAADSCPAVGCGWSGWRRCWNTGGSTPRRC